MLLRQVRSRLGGALRIGVRQMCAAPSLPEMPQRVTVQLQPQRAPVTETEIQEMFEYAAEDVGDISEHWDEAMEVVRRTEEVFPLYKPSEEDLQEVRASQPTLTLASLVHQAPDLQRLVDLGVMLHRWDTMGKLDLAAKIDFERDVAPLVNFLLDIGVNIDSVGRILTFAPGLLEERPEDLKARVAYLVSKNFTAEEISTIVTASPAWLLFSVRGVDARLGFLQKTFGLQGGEVRQLAVSKPSLVIWKGTPGQVKKNLFSINEEMGFTKEEIKTMVLSCPDILKTFNELQLCEQFEVLHNEAGIPHEILVRFPESLKASAVNTRPRLKFLKALNRDQFDPTKPNYISPKLLTVNSDGEFCDSAAKCSEDLYDRFLKIL